MARQNTSLTEPPRFAAILGVEAEERRVVYTD
jgi:hypothetical protein